MTFSNIAIIIVCKVYNHLKNSIQLSNQLWVSWESVLHRGNGLIELRNPHFSGPVLMDCVNIEEMGEIILDLTTHYIILIPKPYLVTLKWEGKQSQDSLEAKFKKMYIHDNELGHLKILKNKDHLLLDCTNHTTEATAKKNVKYAFSTVVYDENKQPYDLTY